MDFGCLNKISDSILLNLKKLNHSFRNNDKDLFYEAVYSLGMIDEKTSIESKNYIYEYLKIQYIPWNNNNTFHFNHEFLTKSCYKNTTLMKEWKIPPSMVYLNKIPYGLFHILTKLNVTGNLYDIYTDLIVY